MAIQKMYIEPESTDPWQSSVIDKDLTIAPGAPSDGDRYIIAGIGGDWSAGIIKDIAQYSSSAWMFVTPLEGMKVYVDDEDKYYKYDGSAWAEDTGGAGISNIVEDLTPQLGGDLDMNGHSIGGNTEAQIDDAVAKKHSQNTDTEISIGDTKVEVVTESGIDDYVKIVEDNVEIVRVTGGKVGISETSPGAKFDVNGDLILQNGTSVDEFSTDTNLAGNSDNAIPTEKAVKVYVDDKVKKNQDNIMLNAFRIAVNGSLTQFNMVDGIVDEYEDESGIDTVNSSNESYNSAGDYYRPNVTAYNNAVKLMLHLNGADAAISTTDESQSGHTITFNGNAQLDTAYKKWGTASLLLDGTGDYLTIPDSADWDFFGSNSDNKSMDFWVRHTDTVSGQQTYFSQHDGSSAFWRVEYYSSTGVIAVYDSTTTIAFNTGNAYQDTDWHHVAVIKVGNLYATYIDGVQEAYVTDNSINTLVGTLRIGMLNFSGYLKGSLDEIYFRHSNHFNASPNVGKTDTITVPTVEYAKEALDMTLISDTFVAETAPDDGRIVILEEDVDAITLNTDLKVFMTIDGGSNWHEGTLSDEGDYDATKRILVADFDVSAQANTNCEYKITTHNLKNLKLHASGLSWA